MGLASYRPYRALNENIHMYMLHIYNILLIILTIIYIYIHMYTNKQISKCIYIYIITMYICIMI